MSKKLEKPYTNEQEISFITEYGQDCRGIRGYTMAIEKTEKALYALEPDEIMQDGEPIKNPNYETEQAQKERERINKLTLTKRQLLLYMYRTYNKTPEDIKSLLGKSDEALIEFEYASVFLRANPLFDNVGNLLGLCTDDIDRIFIKGASI